MVEFLWALMAVFALVALVLPFIADNAPQPVNPHVPSEEELKFAEALRSARGEDFELYREMFDGLSLDEIMKLQKDEATRFVRESLARSAQRR